MKKRLPYILPPIILVFGVLVAVGMAKSRKKPEVRPPAVSAPLVRVEAVTPVDHRYHVLSQGTVEARTEIALTAEVAGRVVSVSPSLAAGGFFAAGEPLAVLEPVDYEAALAEAKARLEQAKVRLAQEEAQAAVARDEWEKLADGSAPPLAARELQVSEARASVDAAEAGVRRAEKNLDRTRVRAPFAGRVREKLVDLGQFVGAGTPVARVYATDYVEVRLPLSSDDAAFVDLPMNVRGGGNHPEPEVRVTAEVAGAEHTWTGRLVRTEGAIDPRTRMLYAVARIDDPYGSPDGANRPPLAVGQFVTVEILGRTAAGAVVLPRGAMRGEGQVLVVDDESRLRFRDVVVLRGEGERVVLGGGLNPGERVCVSPLATVVEGMPVRVAEESGAGDARAAAPADSGSAAIGGTGR